MTLGGHDCGKELNPYSVQQQDSRAPRCAPRTPFGSPLTTGSRTCLPCGRRSDRTPKALSERSSRGRPRRAALTKPDAFANVNSGTGSVAQDPGFHPGCLETPHPTGSVPNPTSGRRRSARCPVPSKPRTCRDAKRRGGRAGYRYPGRQAHANMPHGPAWPRVPMTRCSKGHGTDQGR